MAKKKKASLPRDQRARRKSETSIWLFLLAMLGGMFLPIFLANWFTSFGDMTAITLFVAVGLFSMAGLVVSVRAYAYIWTLFFGPCSFMMLALLDQMARSDILAQVTELGDGVQVVPLLASILFCTAVAVVLCDLFSVSPKKLGWIPAILVFAVIAFPRVYHSVKAINVAADKAATNEVTAKVIDRREEEKVLSVGKFGVTHYPVYYIITARSELTDQGARFRAERKTYYGAPPGEQVKIIFHPGALGAPWAEVVLVE